MTLTLLQGRKTYMLTLLAIWSFLKKCWAWTKEHWKWLIFPVGILLYFVGRWTTKTTVVQGGGDQLHAATGVAEKADAVALKAAADAAVARDKQLLELAAQHNVVLEKLAEEQKKKVEDLQGDPAELNSYLLEVGKSTRSSG